MKKFDVITIFSDLFDDFKSQSLIARAIKKRLITIKAHDLRAWTKDKHRTIDARPYGGGVGMVLMTEPIMKAVKKVRGKKKSRVILMSAKGKQFTQKDAWRLSKYDQLVFIAGRYEGVDERVAKNIADEELSVGPYVLFGGEVPSMIIMEAVSRFGEQRRAVVAAVPRSRWIGMMTRTVLYPDRYTWFVLVSSLDLMLTWAVLAAGGSEGNILADWIIRRWGLTGAVVFKFAVVMLVVCACEYVGRRSDRMGRKLAEWAVAISAVPVVLALLQLLMRVYG